MRKKLWLISLFLLFSPQLLANAPPPIPALTPQGPGAGIYNHQVYSATSPDGLNWTTDGVLLFDHASVPDAVIRNNIIYLYFVDASDGHYMSVAISNDFGKNWTKEKVVIEGRQEAGEAVDPNPILMPDGKIRLFYLGSFYFGHQPTGDIHGIYSALSEDGINFKEETGVRFSYAGITDPDVVKTKFGWKMFVSKSGNIDLSTSSVDGMTFTKDAMNASNHGAISRTIEINGSYHLFKCTREGISSQSTTDFQTWKEDGVRLRQEMGKMICDPGIIRLPDGSYKMFYKQAPIKNLPPGN